MFKRNGGAALSAVTYWSQCREMYQVVLTHNLGILLIVEVFYRA